MPVRRHIQDENVPRLGGLTKEASMSFTGSFQSTARSLQNDNVLTGRKKLKEKVSIFGGGNSDLGILASSFQGKLLE